MSIGKKLKMWGKDKYGSLIILSELLGITQPSLSRYINDKTEPGAFILQKLKKLGCDINWLLSEDIEQNKNTSNNLIDKLMDDNRRMKDQLKKVVYILNNNADNEKQLLEKTQDLLKELSE